MDHPHWVQWADSAAHYRQPNASLHSLPSASTSVAEPPSVASTLFVHPRAAPGCLQLRVVLALIPGVLVCLVGFLSWGLPFMSLSSAIDPLALSVRNQVLKAVAKDVLHLWTQMHDLLMLQRQKWAVEGYPVDPVGEAVPLLRYQYAIMETHSNIVSAPISVPSGGVPFSGHVAGLIKVSGGCWKFSPFQRSFLWVVAIILSAAPSASAPSVAPPAPVKGRSAVVGLGSGDRALF